VWTEGKLTWPDPNSVLGDLKLRNDQWPEYETVERTKYLRQTPAHQMLMVHFTKGVIMKDVFDANAKVNMFSNYMSPQLEAFIVITYVNNYDSWMQKANSSYVPPRRFFQEQGTTATSKPATRGKYNGWAEEGIELFNVISDILEEQRKDTKNRVLVAFDENLLIQFKYISRGTSDAVEEAGPERHNKRARHSLGGWGKNKVAV
jgi:hypothetical protein